MAKGGAYFALCLILLCMIASSAVYLHPAKAQTLDEVTINADGTVTPFGSPIEQTGNTYTLTANIVGSVTIDKSGVVFDGNGQGIRGDEFGVVVSASNVTVENTIISDTSTSFSGPVASNGNPTAAIFVSSNGFTLTGNNTIIGNTLVNNICGLSLFQTAQNKIVENNIVNSSAVAFDLYDSYGNVIYHNNFINNTNQFEDDDIDYSGPNCVNTWDGGFPLGGNYWSDYHSIYPNATEIGDTGIGNTAYWVKPDNLIQPNSEMSEQAQGYWTAKEVFYSKNKDLYPLIQPFNSSFLANYEREIIPPKVVIHSPSDNVYDNVNVSLTFSIDKPFNWAGYSLDGQSNVTINGNTTISDLAYGSHNITVYVNSTFGVIGISKSVEFNVTKSQPFTYTIVILVSVAVIAMVIWQAIVLHLRRRQKPLT